MNTAACSCLNTGCGLLWARPKTNHDNKNQRLHILDGWVAGLLASEYYGPHVYRLSHFLVAAQQSCDDRQDKLVEFLFHPTPSADHARAFFSSQEDTTSAPSALLIIQTNQIELRWEKNTFNIAYDQMQRLLNLYDYCVYTVGYPTLTGWINEACSVIEDWVSNNQGAPPLVPVSELSNKITKAIYRHRKEEGDSTKRQALKKFQTIRSWLGEQCADERLDTLSSCIDDAKVLAFWQEQATKENPGKGEWTTFKNVADSFIDFVKAAGARTARAAEHYALSTEDGQFSAESVHEVMEGVSEDLALLDSLQAPPSKQIKFFNKDENGLLNPILEAGSVRHRLPLTLLRRACIDDHQGRITQLKKDITSGRKKPLDLPRMVKAEDMPTYSEKTADFDRSNTQFEEVALACLHLLITLKDSEALAFLVSLRPDIELKNLAQAAMNDGLEEQLEMNSLRHDNFTMEAGEILGLNRHFFHTLNEECLQNRVLSKILNDAQMAWKQCGKRQGFKKKNLVDGDDRQPGFSQGAPVFLEIKIIFTSYVKSLKNQLLINHGEEALFASDLSIIKKTFATIYGETSNEC